MPTNTRKLDAELLGRETSFEYSEHWVGYAVLGLRLTMGWIFLQAGIEKLMQGDWSAAGFLNNTPAGNPLTGFWTVMAEDWLWLIDPLNVWGQIFIGAALVLGVLVRWSALWGAVMMLFYWLAALQGGLLEGLPLAHGWVVDSHLVYAVLLFGIGAIGAGRILGLDMLLERTAVVRNNRWLRLLLG